MLYHNGCVAFSFAIVRIVPPFAIASTESIHSRVRLGTHCLNFSFLRHVYWNCERDYFFSSSRITCIWICEANYWTHANQPNDTHTHTQKWCVGKARRKTNSHTLTFWLSKRMAKTRPKIKERNISHWHFHSGEKARHHWEKNQEPEKNRFDFIWGKMRNGMPISKQCTLSTVNRFWICNGFSSHFLFRNFRVPSAHKRSWIIWMFSHPENAKV